MSEKVRSYGRFLALLSLVVLMVSCASAKAAGPAVDVVPTEGGSVNLDKAANGSSVELAKGQMLVISLESNPTTGYSWEVVEPDEAVLRQVGEAEFTPQSDLIGASGVEVLRLEGTGAGKMTLKLVYHRPWEKDVEPLETFAVEVTVH